MCRRSRLVMATFAGVSLSAHAAPRAQTAAPQEPQTQIPASRDARLRIGRRHGPEFHQTRTDRRFRGGHRQTQGGSCAKRQARAKQQAATWKVFRSLEPGANGSVLYVFEIDPAVPGADYTVSTILSEAFPEQVQDLYKKYADAYTSGQNFVKI